MTRPKIERMCPFFIVSDVGQTLAFYCDKLGLETWFQEPDEEPFFGIVGRDGAMLFVKAGEAEPMPNPRRDPAMRWDAYLLVPEPDALADEFSDRASYSASRSRTHTMGCVASRSPIPTAMYCSLASREEGVELPNGRRFTRRPSGGERAPPFPASF
jgi:hypothetical protein